MNIQKLRYGLTDFTERKLFVSENYQLLEQDHYGYRQRSDVTRIQEDIREFMPNIPETKQHITPTFCDILVPYEENQYPLSELLCFIYGSINPTFDIVKGKCKSFSKDHFWLDNGTLVYSPGLGIITSKETFNTVFTPNMIIANESIDNYLRENNNLAQFYKAKDPNFSIDFINKIRDEFNKKVEASFEITEELKKHARDDYFAPMRSALTKQRKYLIKTSHILAHPNIPEEFVKDIETKTRAITDTLGKDFSYHQGSNYNCYALSIVLNLYDETLLLHQGYYNFGGSSFEGIETPYHHSWLEKNGIVYDPAMRIITPSELYYQFFTTKDTYEQEETEEMLHRLGYNLTFFSDYLSNHFPADEIMYHRRKIDTEEAYKEGEHFLQKVKTINPRQKVSE